ncbi:NAD(+) synthase [Suttonella ornithocola]|uniref:NH(3)-dependent NAD(+) synthetase n=1 Tax=Suttonella ornithocola TaxID=279832 RepID=A0A380MQF2_9GAMM|nr:NAD(+) synthase [Suttonella ornithocola]SUO94133.1 Probable NH(3)-dependent NAD(+) synthetase [Suttonella ornithocola]
MNMQTYADYLVNWLENQRKTLYKMDGYVLGVSGGVDSAVCAYLLARTGTPVHCYMLPAAVSSETDLTDANAVLDGCGLSGEVISIEPMYQAVMTSVASALHPDPERVKVLHGNVMARLRMVTLFTLAQSYRAVVVGTDNLAESYTGYFTKFGDGAADVLPLARLRKEQVLALAEVLGVPSQIIYKAPSAGLWEGQTDEDELGVNYTVLDTFLRGEKVSKAAQKRIAFWHNRSHHKRMLPPMPEETPNQ